MNYILIAVFDFFKTKSPKLYAVFVALVGLVLVLDGQGYIDVPQWIEDVLITLGLVGGVHTSAAKKEIERNAS